MTQHDNTSFNDPIIHYSQCWEDPRTLIRALSVTPEDDVLSIASGGDNTFALLLQNPRSITTIDRNPAQIFLVELKIRALQTFDYEDFVSFLGARPCRSRLQLYSRVRSALCDAARGYWDRHEDFINDGIIHGGKFEKYFAIFRRFLLPFMHHPKEIRQLLEPKSIEEQRRFYTETWYNKRWQWFFRFFFGKVLLGRLGRDPSFFRYVKLENIAEELWRRTKFGLTEIALHENYFVEYILTGKYKDLENAHPYLRPSNFCFLREHVGRVQVVTEGLEEYLASLPPASFSKFNLSDIFEYMSETEFENVPRVIERVSREDGRLAFWTLFVPKKIILSQTNTMKSYSEIAEQLFASDRTFFYGGFGIWGINEARSRNSPRLETVAFSSKGIAS